MPDIPDIPPELSVNCDRIAYRGEGVQIYQCTGGRWAFQSPRASLYDDDGNLAAEHFAGPTWQAADGSTVVGQKIAESTGGRVDWKSPAAAGESCRMPAWRCCGTWPIRPA
jgi:hypothetical protein